MPFQLLSVEGVAHYLHLTPQEVEQRVKDGEIPFERRGKRVVFRKREIEDWASRRILSLPGRPLTFYHGKSTRDIKNVLREEAILAGLLQEGALDSAMTSKTKASVLCDLAALAEKTGHLCDAKILLESLKLREELCSTAAPGGFALPHPRFHESNLFEASFIVAGRTIQGIHFGAPDGEPTHLFFLICCQDDRLHLHTLARLCLIAKNADVMERLLEAPDAQVMRDILIGAERQILEEWNLKPQGGGEGGETG